jgi:hypothetical protein
MLRHTCRRHPEWPRLPDPPSIALRNTPKNHGPTLESTSTTVFEKTQNLGAIAIGIGRKHKRKQEAMPRYYCDYCDVYLTHGSVRRRSCWNSRCPLPLLSASQPKITVNAARMRHAMWSRTVRNALEARSVADNDSDSDRSDASTPTSSPTRPTSSPTRPAPNRRRTAALAKILASCEDVHAPASELNTAETLLIDGDLSRQCRQCANVAVAEEAPEAAHEVFKPEKDADSTRSAEAVGPFEPEVRPSLSTRLSPHTAAEEEEEEIPSHDSEQEAQSF